MESTTYPTTETPAGAKEPTIAFVSLGCPKALTDSELILTQLRAEGYGTSKSYSGADLVVVNTCGFIDDAVKESLDAIGGALRRVTACGKTGPSLTGLGIRPPWPHP